MVTTRTTDEPGISARGLVKRYGSVTAIAGVGLEVGRGEITALLGPNGAGKTTLVSLALGLIRPDAGSVAVLGGDPAAIETRRRVGSMLQIAAVPETLTVHEHLELACAWYGDPLPVAEVVRLAGLEGLEQRRFGRLSGGQQRRVLFALAVAGAPELLILDEPTVALDVEARRALWSSVRALAAAGTAVLLTTHDLTEAAELASRVVLLHRGQVVADGTPEEVSARAGLKRIRCRTSVDVAVVEAWPGVTRVAARGVRLEIDSQHPETTVRALLAADAELADLEVVGSGLEDALIALTTESAAAAA